MKIVNKILEYKNFYDDMNEIKSFKFSKKISDLDEKIILYLNLSSIVDNKDSVYLVEDIKKLFPTAICVRDHSIEIKPFYNYIESIKEIITNKIEDCKKSLEDYKKFNSFSLFVYNMAFRKLENIELDFKKDCKKLSQLKYNMDNLSQSVVFPLK